MVTLTADEVQRYKRHLVLRDVGAPGQQKLKAARVLVVGAGGLGSPVLMYLAAAGVGTIGVIDDDRVAIDNLQRQIVHREEDVGRLKVESARDAVARINPLVNVETIAERLEPANALDIIGRYDIVADGTDNFATRYLVSDACYLRNGRWPMPRSGRSTVTCRFSNRTRPMPAGCPIRRCAAYSRSRRRRALSPTARRPAFSGLSPASSEPCRRPRSSRKSWA